MSRVAVKAQPTKDGGARVENVVVPIYRAGVAPRDVEEQGEELDLVRQKLLRAKKRKSGKRHSHAIKAPDSLPRKKERRGRGRSDNGPRKIVEAEVVKKKTKDESAMDISYPEPEMLVAEVSDSDEDSGEDDRRSRIRKQRLAAQEEEVLARQEEQEEVSRYATQHFSNERWQRSDWNQGLVLL